MIVHVKQDAARTTVTYRADGQRWTREMPRVVLREKMRSNLGLLRFTSLQPIFHVPGPDAEAEVRWVTWRAETCAAPAPLRLRELCREGGYALAKAADLGALTPPR